jgi:mRNA-degrading endonuclease RelE of RelBE toxin-antitoxin system
LRIVYRIDGAKIEVFVIAVGLRRDDEIYKIATKRLP